MTSKQLLTFQMESSYHKIFFLGRRLPFPLRIALTLTFFYFFLRHSFSLWFSPALPSSHSLVPAWSQPRGRAACTGTEQVSRGTSRRHVSAQGWATSGLHHSQSWGGSRKGPMKGNSVLQKRFSEKKIK